MGQLVNNVVSGLGQTPVHAASPDHGLNFLEVLVFIPMGIVGLVIISEICKIVFEERAQPNQGEVDENENGPVPVGPAGIFHQIVSIVFSPHVFILNCLLYGFDTAVQDWTRLQNDLLIAGPTDVGPIVSQEPSTSQTRKRSFRAKANKKGKSSERKGSKGTKRVKVNSSPSDTLSICRLFRDDKLLFPVCDPTDNELPPVEDARKPVSRKQLKALAAKLAGDCQNYYLVNHSIQAELGQDFVIVHDTEDSPIEDAEMVYNSDCEPESDHENTSSMKSLSEEDDDMVIV